MTKELVQLSYEERLRNLELFILEKRRFREDLINAYKYLKGRHKMIGFSSLVPLDKTKGNGHKVKHRRLCPNTRITFWEVQNIRNHYENDSAHLAYSSTACM